MISSGFASSGLGGSGGWAGGGGSVMDLDSLGLGEGDLGGSGLGRDFDLGSDLDGCEGLGSSGGCGATCGAGLGSGGGVGVDVGAALEAAAGAITSPGFGNGASGMVFSSVTIGTFGASGLGAAASM